MQDLLAKAIEIAKTAHNGQVDKKGKPYISHPLRVMNKMDTASEKIVAILHDVVEDSELTLKDLTASGFSDRIIEAIDAITKREGQQYENYLARVMNNSIAIKVKIADMTDNADISRIPHPTDKDRARIERYKKNLPKLQDKLQAI